MPSPEEIEAVTAEMQAGWTEADRLQHLGQTEVERESQRLTVPVVRTAELRDFLAASRDIIM